MGIQHLDEADSLAGMPSKGKATKVRGRPIELPLWWLKTANRASSGWDLTELATALTRAASRPVPWRRETVGDFLRNESTTHELAEAFCKLFDDLLPPVFVATTYEEAHQLRETLRRIRGVTSNPEKSSQRTQLVKAREELERSVSDQTKALDSADEGIGNRRRPRGVGGGRSPT